MANKTAIPKAALMGTAALVIALSPALATHAWNGYHWARSGPELTMKVGSNVSAKWIFYYNQAVADWNVSGVIEAVPAAGAANPKNCKPVAGRIEACSSAYGRTGWLGIAQIWLSGGHITQAITKLNDTYFNTATYDTPQWRALVTCQEIGHDYGLSHQDENFSNPDLTDAFGKQTCMDYTRNPAGNEHPNAHDYDELLIIYDHVETDFGTRTLRSPNGAQVASEAAGGDTPAEWGRVLTRTADGRPDTFELTIAPGRKLITHVFWALGEGPRGL